MSDDQPRELRFHLERVAFELDEQDRGGAGRIPGIDGGLGRVDGEAVHDLHRAGQQAGTDDPRDGVAGRLERAVAGEHRSIGLGPRNQAKRDLDGDPEEPLGSDEQSREIGARLLDALAAEARDLAVRQHHGRAPARGSRSSRGENNARRRN